MSASRNPSVEDTGALATLGVHTFGLLPIVVGNRLLGAMTADRAGPPAPELETVTFLCRLRNLTNRAFVRSRTEGRAAAGARTLPPERKYETVGVAARRAGDRVSQETGVPEAELDAWRRHLLSGAMSSPKDPGGSA